MFICAARITKIVVTAANTSCADIGRRYALTPTASFSCEEHGLAWHAGVDLSVLMSMSQPGIFSCLVFFEALFLCSGHIPFAQQSATCVDTSAPASGAACVPESVSRKTTLAIRRTIKFTPVILLFPRVLS